MYEEHEISLLRIRGMEYCGAREYHGYELYLTIEEIDHTKIKAGYPKTNGICECFHKTIQDEFYAVAFHKKYTTSLKKSRRFWEMD